MIVPRYFRLFGVVKRSGVCRICSPYSAAAASSAVKPEGGVPLEQGPPIVPPGETEPEISPRVQELADQILNLSLLQAADLNKVLKKKLKISDAPMMPAGMMMAAMNKKPSAKPAEEKKGVEEKKIDKKKMYSAKLVKFDDAKKITLIKLIRDLIPGLNLVQAKKFIESAPVEVKGNLGSKDAEDLKAKLEAVGGTVELE